MKKNLYVLLLLMLPGLSLAQKGRFAVQFNVKSLDCNTGKVVIRVQVKANSADSTFLMGDANYRFDYDSQIIRNPQIISQENFSNQAPASDSRYNQQNLNGSTAGPTLGTVSLNTVYGGSGTGAKQVGTDWITVSCIQFDIINTQVVQNNCFGLRWHTDTTFPVTGLSEVVAKKNGSTIDSYVVKAGGIFQSLTINPVKEICGGFGFANANDLMIPEGFSPNGDGINDFFVIHHLGALKADVTIFNMNGHIVYANPNYQNDWGGQNEQGTVPDGTYFYSIHLSDGRSFRRSMTITH
ncbi:gliding motility-associated C-terminal domain-containing protein [Spirosoma flavus]